MGIVEALQFLKPLKDAFGLLKEAKDLLPESPKKTEVIVKIEEAEESLKIAKTEAAKALGYYLCKCTFPPQIMLFDKSENVFKCPRKECGHEIKRTIKPKTRNPGPYSGWLKR